MGIEHPTHPKTKEPIIITTDFLLTRLIGGQVTYEAISVKPEDESDEQRVLEKLEIERVWWELLGVKFSYYIGNELTQIQSRNINWATHPLRSEMEVFTEHEMDFATSFLISGNHFIRDISDQFVNEMGMKHEMALTMLRSLIGSKRVNVDLSSSLENANFINIFNIRNVKKDLVNGAC